MASPIGSSSPYQYGMTASGTKNNSSTNTTTGSSKANNAISAFLEYQKMTPEEKLRDAILKKLDLTEEELAALPPEARAKVEDKIKTMMKEEIENNLAEKGVLVDLSA